MNGLFGWLGRVSRALALLTMLMLGVLVLLVTADVLVRSAGLRPLSWATSVAEYVLLYAAFLPMPALVRGKGHVFVEFMRTSMPAPARRACEMAVYLVCIVICVYLGWVATAHGIEALRTGAYETRTFDMPRWLVFLPMAIGFWLSALEWLRYLVGADSMYDVDPLSMEGF